MFCGIGYIKASIDLSRKVLTCSQDAFVGVLYVKCSAKSVSQWPPFYCAHQNHPRRRWMITRIAWWQCQTWTDTPPNISQHVNYAKTSNCRYLWITGFGSVAYTAIVLRKVPTAWRCSKPWMRDSISYQHKLCPVTMASIENTFCTRSEAWLDKARMRYANRQKKYWKWL